MSNTQSIPDRLRSLATQCNKGQMPQGLSWTLREIAAEVEAMMSVSRRLERWAEEYGKDTAP